ncbi:MAG: hypothetical protein IJP45_03175 [Paludibacteraceae bacterium]|nr:hypothetical protein [Paludibacteraceae bacterium]MBQ6764171.1 hypothetical protein [Paludibacteraceae bacterium]
MKTVNKYLFLLAAAVFGLTACEKQVERDESPAGNPNAVAFSQSKVSEEFNPSKVALEYEIKVGRSVADSALTVNFDVEGDVDVIKVPTSVSFAAGEKEVPLKLTFPTAEVDSTYSIVLKVQEANESPYTSGATTFEFTAIIAAWEPAATNAIVFDGIVNVFYSTGTPGWYVPYLRKDNSDGSFDIRLLNPYTVLPDYLDGDYDSPIEDQFGLYKGFPYNYPEDVDSKGTYNMDIHVLADKSATFDQFDLGMSWTYGEFYGAHAADNGLGVYDEATNTITFPGGSVACAMANYKSGSFYLGETDFVIYLDAQAYQNDHLSISDFNASDIEWVEQESTINTFESTIFNFTNEDQKLFKAVDPYPENPKSPFINLWSLRNAYAAGGNLAFYWDGEDGDLVIPTPQNTKLSFMQQDLLIVEAAGQVVTTQVKGTDVKIFTFDIVVASTQGNLVGEFVETFTMAQEAVIFDKADFVGSFAMAGYSPFDGSEDVRNVEIKAEGEELIILGFDYCDTIKTSFDAESGVLTIAPQALPGVFTYKEADYDLALYTMLANGSTSTSATIDLAFKLDGAIHLTKTTAAVGFLVRAENLGWLDGIYDFVLTVAEPVAPEAAPFRAPAIRNSVNMKHTVSGSKPSVSNISFKGKYRPSLKKNLSPLN